MVHALGRMALLFLGEYYDLYGPRQLGSLSRWRTRKTLVSFQTKSAQSKLDAISDKLDKVKKEITRLEVGIKSSERDLKKSKDKVDNYESEITELQNKMKELSTERQAVLEANQMLKTEVEEFEVCIFLVYVFRIKSWLILVFSLGGGILSHNASTPLVSATQRGKISDATSKCPMIDPTSSLKNPFLMPLMLIT